MPLEQAVEEHPDLVEPYFAQAAARTTRASSPPATPPSGPAACSSTSPKNIQLEKPIQVVWLIDEPGTAQWAHTLVVVGEHAECSIREYFLGGRLRGPGAARRRLRALRRARARRWTSPTTRTGAAARCTTSRRGGSRSARRARQVGADPPRRPPHQADARHHHRRAGLGHAPHGPVLHRARRAPRPVHHRQARGRPHHRRHGLEGRAHRRVARVLRGPDPHRAEGGRDGHLPADALRCCSRRRPRATRSPR